MDRRHFITLSIVALTSCAPTTLYFKYGREEFNFKKIIASECDKTKNSNSLYPVFLDLEDIMEAYNESEYYSHVDMRYESFQ